MEKTVKNKDKLNIKISNQATWGTNVNGNVSMKLLLIMYVYVVYTYTDMYFSEN